MVYDGGVAMVGNGDDHEGDDVVDDDDKDLGHHGLGVPWHLGVHQHYFKFLLRMKSNVHGTRIFKENLG